MIEQGKNILIGVFVLAAIVLVVWMVLFLHPAVGDEDQTLRVYFTNIERIKVGTRVTYAGRSVGQVVQIRELPCQRREASGENALYNFELILGVDSDTCVFNTDKITAVTSGFFGDRSIEITPVRPPPGVASHRIKKGEIMYAKASDQIGDALGNLSSLSDTVGVAFEKFSELIDTNSENINSSILSFKNAMDEMGLTFSEVNQVDLIGTLKKAFTNLNSVFKNIDGHLKELEQEGFWPNLSNMVENLAAASDNVKSVTDDVKEGRGSIGQLLSSDDLYLELMSLMGKADTVMNDINNYGVMFQTNKGWQRKRSKKANAMKALSDPREFNRFFDCELCEIRTCLGRVTALLEKAECTCPNACLTENPCFTKQFAELLRKVECLEKRLKQFNEHVCDCDPCCPGSGQGS